MAKLAWNVLATGAVTVSLAAATAGGEAEPLYLSLLSSELTKPLYVTAAPGDHARVFVVEQFDASAIGRIRFVRNGVLEPEPFLELGPVATYGATGVLCLAFAPDYQSTGLFYVFYTDAAADVLISRFEVSADPDVADASSEQVVVKIPQPHHFHQGGWLGFGPDDFLYISSGDGGPGYDPDRRGQDPDSLLGKILRIDVNGDDFPGDPLRNYAIPADNPFVGEKPLDEIWALGVREVWRGSFDRLTGDLYLADVGQEGWEEIDFEPAGFPGGANYGWSCREGDHPFIDDPSCAGVTFTPPVHEYALAKGRCAIIGGYVYRGAALSQRQGRYFFAEHCTGQIWSFRYDGASVIDFAEHPVVAVDEGVQVGHITSFGEDDCGELYLTTTTGQLFRMVAGSGGELNCTCPWDMDGSGVVSAFDLLTLLAAWGEDPGGPPDFDGDGTVGATDLLFLLAAWGSCP